MIKAAEPVVAAVVALAHEAMAAAPGQLAIVGVCGSQASGKSTLTRDACARLGASGIPAATLSLDDIYLTRNERGALAQRVHPLFATRGVPGTHDLALGHAVLDALARGEPALLPRFEKARDDRADPARWPAAPAGCRVLFLEGWCVGAAPEPEAALVEPVNALETAEDAQGVWRRHANTALSGPYAAFFARLDRLVLFAAPGFEIVEHWRLEQEKDNGFVMDRAQVVRFVAHYERLTRWILAEMPARADLVVRLDPRRRPLAVTRR